MPSNASAVDYYLKVDGVPGESQDAKHKGEIEVLSFSWGATQQGTGGAGGGQGAGRVSMQDFHFTMRTNKASPVLFARCSDGQHLKSAILTCRKAGGKQEEYLTVTMTDCLVSAFQIGGSASGNDDAHPVDQASFNFAKIEWQYCPQKQDGTLDSPVKCGWDLKQNTKV